MRRRISILLVLCMLASLVLSGCGKTTETLPSEPTPSPTPDPVPEGVYITEVMGINRGVLRDEDGDFSDWFEIENRSGTELSMEGWTVSDGEDKEGWSFPERTLAPGERLLVFASGKDRTGVELHTDFSLSDGEGLILRDRFGQEICRFEGADYSADVSRVLQEDGNVLESRYPTPGRANTTEDYDALQACAEVTGPLILNEVVVDNHTSRFDAPEEYPDWVEIKNISDREVELSDYYLSDRSDERLKCRLPEITLEPGYKMVLYCVGSEAAAGNFRCIGLKLDSEQEDLYLSNGEGELLDYASLRDIPYCGSYGRMEGENGWFFFSQPSPGGENTNGARRVSAMPQSPEAAGVINGTLEYTVTLTAENGAVIYYTLDGSLPDESSPVYTGPITIRATGALRAIAVEPGQLKSRVLTQEYFLNEGFTLPVVSLRADDPQAFQRMYSGGWKNLELPGTISFYEQGGSFSLGAGFSMNGETSLVLAKKNIAMRFRGSYGAATLNYDLYGGGVTEFTNLLLRSGQDYYYGGIRNELCQALAQEMGGSMVSQRTRYVILYVNGSYYGIYSLKEKVNEQLYASLAGVSKDSVELVEATVQRSSSFYSEVYELIVNHDMSDPEWYARACAVLDMDSLIDWIILEGFSANTDLRSGNVRYVRSSENDGKWRLVFYDLDATFRQDIFVMYNIFGSDRQIQQVSQICTALKKNPDFRTAFLTRFSQLIRTVLSDEHVLELIDGLEEELSPEIPRDYAAYDRGVSGWSYYVNHIRSRITNYDWDALCINHVCRIFSVTEEEKEAYFGSGDGALG